MVCWGDNRAGESNAPAGRFTAVGAGRGHSCGLRTNGRIVCWGSNVLGQSDAPAGRFTAVSTRLGHTRGRRTGGRIECRGAEGAAFLRPARRRRDRLPGFERVRSDGRSGGCVHRRRRRGVYSCGIRTDATVVYWGDRSSWYLYEPNGGFISVTAGLEVACGIRTNGIGACWNCDLPASKLKRLWNACVRVWLLLTPVWI